MRRRRYVMLSATVTGLALAGLSWVVVSVFAPRHAAVIVAGFGVAGALVGGIVGHNEYVRRWAKLRLLAGACRELGFAYRKKVPPKDLEPFRQLEFFQANRYTAATDWMQGVRQGESVLVFDFEPSGTNQATRTAAQAVVVLPESAGGLPAFQLRPRHRLRDFLGDDVSFDPEAVADPELRAAVERFVKCYVVQGMNEERLRQTFTPETLRFFSEYAGWVIQCDGRHMLLYRPGKTELSDRPHYVDDALALRKELGGQMATDEEALAALPVVPGKERGPGYRTAQMVWRTAMAIGSGAFFGGMFSLHIFGRRNPLVAARNGALVGAGIVVVLMVFIVLVTGVETLRTMLLARRPGEADQEE